jgi:CHAT domain-containing protein/tetratricopeptide (TPR) repeat protein
MRLARAYEAAWADSFLTRQVAWFMELPPTRRARRVIVDSLRRAGVLAYGQDGPDAAIELWRRSLASADEINDIAGAAAALGNIGAAYLALGRLDSAAASLTRAAVLAADVGDLRVEANAVGALADVRAEQRQLDHARSGYAQALRLRQRIGDMRGVAATHNSLGLLAQDLGELDEARRQFEAALELNRANGNDAAAAVNLVNMAGLDVLAGRLRLAAAAYRRSLEIWRSRRERAQTGEALVGLGQVELRRGNYPAARAAFAEALQVFEESNQLAAAVSAKLSLTATAAAMGDIQGALNELRQAQRLADSARVDPGERAAIALLRGDLAFQLNALSDAEGAYRVAEALYREAADPLGRAAAQHGRAFLSIEREDYEGAEELLRAASRVQRGAGDRRGVALTTIALGRVARERDDTARARRLLAGAVAELQALGDPVAVAAAIGDQAELEAKAGMTAAAERLYRLALSGLDGYTVPDLSWRLRLGLALARRTQGAHDDAVSYLNAAASDIERPRRAINLAERRAAFSADKWVVYTQLALLHHERRRWDAAFAASERLRAREMHELLARGRVPVADTAVELVEREQDLRRRIASLTQGLSLGAGGSEILRGPDVSFATSATREALSRAQRDYATLLLELRERAPRHASLIIPNVAGWREVARRLAPEEAFVEYLVSDSGSVALLVTRDTLVGVSLGVTRRELARLIEFVRGTMERPPASEVSDAMWRGPLRRLDEFLIAPVERTGLLVSKRRLILVPHAELHYMPLAALLDRESGRFLIQRYELSVTPSASIWLSLGRRQPSGQASGVLALAPRPDKMPGSGLEVAAVADFMGTGVRVLRDQEATELAFRAEAMHSRVIHLATYGILNKHNPLFSFVELVPEGRHDGRLEVHEVLGLTLSAELVVLSACQTALGSGRRADVPPGDDWISLARAFLHAGARSVVATLWPIEDRASAVLMTRFYRAYARDSDPASALATAQRELLTLRSTAHPFYWAGYVAMGGASRR